MEWWQWLIAISGVLGAWRVIWLLIEEIVDARRAYPILMEIAEQFHPNGGLSLHDRINQLTEYHQTTAIRLDNISKQLEALITDQVLDA